MSFQGRKAEICKSFGKHDGKIGTIRAPTHPIQAPSAYHERTQEQLALGQITLGCVIDSAERGRVSDIIPRTRVLYPTHRRCVGEFLTHRKSQFPMS